MEGSEGGTGEGRGTGGLGNGGGGMGNGIDAPTYKEQLYRMYGPDLAVSNDEYVNNAWKHMIKQDRLKVKYSEGHYETNDKGDVLVNGRPGGPSNRPEREQALRWENYVDSANTYMEAAGQNRTNLAIGNALLIGDALEEEANKSGGRAGNAIREVRPA